MLALGKILPVADREIVRRGPAHRPGNPVAIAIDDLCPSPDNWGHAAYRRALAIDLVHVGGMSDWTVPEPKLTLPVMAHPGITRRLFAPMLAMVFRMRDLRAVADLRHRDYGSHADNHAQGRQGRSHRVPPQSRRRCETWEGLKKGRPSRRAAALTRPRAAVGESAWW